MAWRDELRQASFRGVSFKVDTAGLGIGRRLARHEYPQRDLPYMEDMGRKAREYRIDALIIGADYMSGRDELIDAIETSGHGQLVHPYHGTLLVTVSDCSLTESTQLGGMAKFSITFVEAGKANEPNQAADTEGVLDAQYGQCQLDFVEDFSQKFSVDGLPDFAVDDALSGVQDLMDLPGVALGELNSLRANTSSALRGLLPENLSGTLFSAAALGLGIVSLINSATKLNALLGFSIPTNAAAATPTSIAQNNNRLALSGLVAQAATARRVMDLSTASFPALDDARLARTEVVTLTDNVLFSDATGDLAAMSITQLRTAAIANFSAMMPNLPLVISVVPKTVRPSLAIVHETYGDRWLNDGREDDLLARNKIVHPGFIPGGDPLEMVSV